MAVFTRMTRLLVTPLAIAGALVACTDGESPVGPPRVPDSWLTTMNEAIDNAESVGDIPVLEYGDDCDVLDPPKVGESQSRSSGSGVSTYGEHGRRYICEFASPSMTLIVGETRTAEDFAETTLDHSDSAVELHPVDGAEIAVLARTYSNGRAEHTAELVDPRRFAFVSVEMETRPGTALPPGWSTADTARMLASFVRS